MTRELEPDNAGARICNSLWLSTNKISREEREGGEGKTIFSFATFVAFARLKNNYDRHQRIV